MRGAEDGVRIGRLNTQPVWPYCPDMTTTIVKTTGSLDADTGRELEDPARRRGTSRSAAPGRAIRPAAKQARPDDDEALNRLQSLLGLDQESANLWADEVRQERRASPRNTSSTHD